MRETDIDGVVAAEARSYAFPWSRGNFLDSLRAGHSAWVCHDGAELLGYALMMMVVDEAQLLNITILPERQGQGVGSELLSHVLRVARDHGA